MIGIRLNKKEFDRLMKVFGPVAKCMRVVALIQLLEECPEIVEALRRE